MLINLRGTPCVLKSLLCASALCSIKMWSWQQIPSHGLPSDPDLQWDRVVVRPQCLLIRKLLSEFCLQNIYPSFSHWSWVSSRALAIPIPPKASWLVWTTPSLAAHELSDFANLDTTMNPMTLFLRTNHFPKLLGKEWNRIGEDRRMVQLLRWDRDSVASTYMWLFLPKSRLVHHRSR